MKRYLDLEAILDDAAKHIDWEDRDVLEAYIEGIMCHIAPNDNIRSYKQEHVDELYGKCGYFNLPLSKYVVEIKA